MGKVLGQFSLAMLVAAGSIVLWSKPVASVVETVDLGPASEVTVADQDGYFIITIGRLRMIVVTDANSG